MTKILNSNSPLQFSSLLTNYCKTPSAELDCLRALESFCRDRNRLFTDVAAKTMQMLYDDDVIQEETILKWYKEPPVDEGEDEDEDFDDGFAEVIREKVKPLIDWLEESEEEDSDE